MAEPGDDWLELEKRLSAELLRLSRINRDLLRDRIFRDKERLLKERSDINLLLLLYEAQQREAAAGGVAPVEIQELLRARSGGELDEREVERLRRRRSEIGEMLREIEHVAEDHRELSQDKVAELSRERDNLKARVIGMLEAPGYFDHRVRKIRRQLQSGKREKVLRHLRGLQEQLGATTAVQCFKLLAQLADPEADELPLPEVLSLVGRAPSGPFLQAFLAEIPSLRKRYPDGWKQAVLAALGNVSLFRGVPFETRSEFWSGDELRAEVAFQRLAVQNPSAPPELLGVLLGCPAEELERCRARARRSYGGDGALDTMAEVLRAATDPELIARILDIVDDEPILRYRFYHIAMRHGGLPAPLAARIVATKDCSVEDFMDFRRRNPDLGAAR